MHWTIRRIIQVYMYIATLRLFYNTFYRPECGLAEKVIKVRETDLTQWSIPTRFTRVSSSRQVPCLHADQGELRNWRRSPEWLSPCQPDVSAVLQCAISAFLCISQAACNRAPSSRNGTQCNRRKNVLQLLVRATQPEEKLDCRSSFVQQDRERSTERCPGRAPIWRLLRENAHRECTGTFQKNTGLMPTRGL